MQDKGDTIATEDIPGEHGQAIAIHSHYYNTITIPLMSAPLSCPSNTFDIFESAVLCISKLSSELKQCSRPQAVRWVVELYHARVVTGIYRRLATFLMYARSCTRSSLETSDRQYIRNHSSGAAELQECESEAIFRMSVSLELNSRYISGLQTQ